MSRVLRALIRLYPRAFRERFGGGVAAQVEDGYAAARTKGSRAVVAFVLGTAVDLVSSAMAERVHPTWRDGSLRQRRNGLMGMLRSWTTDLRLAARSLLRAPGFTAVTVCTLGLAIGVNAGMFTVVRTVLLDPLPFRAPDRLMHVAATAPGSGMPDEFGVSAEFLVHYGERSQHIESLALYNSFTNTLRVGEQVERIRMSTPTWTLFGTLGVVPVLGRAPVEEDQHVALLSHELWATWFGSDPAVVGRSIEVFSRPHTVIGVMAPGFEFPLDGTMLWLPQTVRPGEIRPGAFGPRLLARVRRGVTPAQLADELTALSKELPERFGGSANYAQTMERHRAVVRPLDAEVLGPVTGPLLVLLGAVGIVLLIACANVANLFAVRAEWRHRELAVRRAIGAGRARLIQTQLAESVVVAAASVLLAVVLAALTLPLLVSAAPDRIPRIGEARLDGGTLLFTAAAAVLAALACGVGPAVRASVADMGWLRDGTRGATRRRSWGRDGLVVAQTSLALVLLIGSSLLVRSFRAVHDVDPGYDTADVLTFQIAPEGPHLPDGPAYARFAHEFMERLAALPGVQRVGLVENVPLNEGTAMARFMTEEMPPSPDAGILLDYTFTAGDYFAVMDIAVLQGRAFEDGEHEVGARSVMVSRGAADMLWPGLDPLGRRIQDPTIGEWYSVVGVVEDVKQNGLRDRPQATVYLPLVGPTPTSWVIGSPAYVMKTTRAETIVPEVRAIVRELAPEAPMYRVYTMAGLAADAEVRLSFTMLVLGIVSALALILGAVGLYGVLSYVVAQRRREIGVRLALGAEARRVRRMIVGQGARLVALGVMGGILAALLSTRALDSLLYGVGAIDAVTFGAMSAWMVGVGLLASWVPALRASRVDPMESLRE
jgi:putative ABC transport system permease protein